MYGNLIPDGFLQTLFVLALIGLIALVAAGGYGLYWLISHLQWVA